MDVLLACIQTVGIEATPHNVQVNAIAQNFVDNPTCFPADCFVGQVFPVSGVWVMR